MSFFKILFGPSRKEVWTELTKEIGADFYYGGFFGKDEFIYSYKSWNVHLDISSHGTSNNSRTFTRLRAPFYNSNEIKAITNE